MDAIIALYQSQPFWIWLAIGALILAVEAAAGTEWLLWPAVSAGVVALLTLAGVRLGLPAEIAAFAVLTIASTLASRKLISRVTPPDVDINDRRARLVGLKAQVTAPFVEGRGRVFVSGSEWPADLDGDGPPVGGSVVVDGYEGSRLRVRPWTE